MKKREKRLRLSFVGVPVKDWLYFEHFFFLPAIATFDMNVYHYGDKYLYERMFTLYIWWFDFSIGWKHGLAEK